jgi:membrane-bound lytic murein transglycosylase D
MKKIIGISALIVLVIAAVAFLTFATHKLNLLTESDDAYRDAFARNYKMFSVEIPEKLDFAGEKVPVDNYYVRESLDRELLVNSYWHSSTILMFKRSLRWFNVIQPILKKNNIPDDFLYLCMIESGFENVVSPAGAAGFWQILKSTGISNGLEINTEVDERYHVEKATEAACRYLKGAYARFNNWTLVAASFNMGVVGLDNQLKAEKTDNYYDLQLNKESLRYVYRILAVKTIFRNPVKYGFYLRKKDFYPPVITKTVTIDTAIADLSDFAKKYAVSYRVLKELNPWLLKSSLTNKERKKYDILIPLNGNMSFKELIKQWEQDSLVFNDTLRIDQIK